ncbi:hypothetical protein [Persicitalea sp.]|uniref:hypothetical protein n=1 Tax=Persicitalea sp. TaxID=3100273 RepID=UPI003594355E
MKKSLLLLFLLTFFSCKQTEVENPADPLLGLGHVTPAETHRAIDRCCFTYTLSNYAPKAAPQISTPYTQLFLLGNGFAGWLRSAESLTGTYVSPESHADFVFQFVSPGEGTFPPDTLPLGWLPQPVASLSRRTDLPDGTVFFFLNADHFWTADQLTRIFLYQIGAALGLAASDNPQSVMYPFMVDKEDEAVSSLFDLATTEKVRELYGKPSCNEWLGQDALPFTLPARVETVTVNEKALLLFPDEGQLWEFDPQRKPAWQPKKIPPPLPGLLMLFPANNKAYALTTDALWEYDLAQDQWLRHPKALPFVPTPGAFGMASYSLPDFRQEIGFVFYLEKTNGDTFVKTWQYEPTLGAWTPKKAYNLGPLATTSHALFTPAPYGGALVQVPGQPLALEYFTESDAWAVRPAYPNYRTDPLLVHSWALRDRAYALAASGQLWQYAGRTWVELGATPFPTAEVSFHFSLKCRGFAGTRSGKFWEYLP